jgi:hypothetical protein
MSRIQLSFIHVLTHYRQIGVSRAKASQVSVSEYAHHGTKRCCFGSVDDQFAGRVVGAAVGQMVNNVRSRYPGFLGFAEISGVGLSL